MRSAFTVFCAVLLCSPGAAAEDWNHGKVVHYHRGPLSADASATGPGQEIGHTTYSLQIDGGDRIYVVERTLNFVWQKFPALTENGPVEWRVKGKDMIIRDDDGKKFTLSIVEMRRKE